MNKIIYFIKRIPHRIWRVVSIIRTFENWPIWLQERYNLFHNYNKGDELIVHLRSGIKFYFKFRNGEFGPIDEIWCGKVYMRHYQIKDGDVVIDIGANIGGFSIFAAMEAKGVKVFSYEPTPETFSTLIKNIRINNLENFIYPFQLGVAKTVGKGTLFLRPDGCDTSNTLINRNNLFIDKNNSLCIQTITLKDIFKNNNLERCDFLKIDAEGAEYEILFNTPPDYLQNIKYIALEYHRGYEEIVFFLKRHNFSVWQKPTSKTEGFIWAKRI